MYTNSYILSFFLSSLILSSFHIISIADDPEVDEETPFSYEEGADNGPGRWGQINPNWTVCDNGEMQSPIDLLDEGVETFHNLGRLKTEYKPSPATAKNRGHDITVKWKEDAGKININGTDYKLLQCHWHSPSEHQFNRSSYNMELHLVHQSSTGENAVVGITYKYGQPDPFLAKIIPNITSLGEEEKDLGMLDPRDIKFGGIEYYRYIGSLTVPPCVEGVIWTILKKVSTVSREQVKILREIVHDGYEENARPIQQRNGRWVWLYDPKVNGGSA